MASDHLTSGGASPQGRRTGGTSRGSSFVLYLAYLPFHTWAVALLIGLSMLAVYLIGRPGDAATAAITTAVGVAAAWLGLRMTGRRPEANQ